MNRHHLLLVHGADRLAFGEDIAAGEQRGMVVHALDLPRFTGHPIDDVHAHYLEVSAMIEAEAAGIRRADADAFIAGIGRNLGGSMLAFHVTRSRVELDALVLTGAIPDLSRFKAKAIHQGAQRYREQIDGTDDAARFGRLADLDLVATLPAIGASTCLLQAGLADPWLDETSFAVLGELEQAGFTVEYLRDDHAMVAPVTLERRWRFIDGLRGA